MAMINHFSLYNIPSCLDSMDTPEAINQDINIELQDKRPRWKKFLPSGTSIMLLLYIIATLLLSGVVSPLTRRGFFCDDSSINYPFKVDTIGFKTLFFIALIIPSFIIKFCDILLEKQLKKLPQPGKSFLYNRFYKWRRKKLSDNMIEVDPEEMDLISSNVGDNVKRRQLVCNEDSSDCELVQYNSKSKSCNDNSCANYENNDNSEIESNSDIEHCEEEEVNLFSSVSLESDNKNNSNHHNEQISNGTRQLSSIGTIPTFFRKSFGDCQLFVFGFGSNLLFTGIGKVTCGRMRPHFMQRCVPNIDCSLRENWNRYIEEFTCTNSNLLQRDLSYITTSWPSGHASAIFFSMIYLIIYLNITIPILVKLGNEKLKKRYDPLILYATYVVMIGLAGYIALTRVSDYHHHPLDVLSGTVIGAITAVATSRSILSREYSKLVV